MAASRRQFLTTLLAASALPRLTWAAAGNPSYLAAARAPDGSYGLHGLAATGESLFRIALPSRGHAAAAHPTRPEAVAFARRPGTFALVIGCTGGAVLARLTPPEGRQFNGHGCYSADGRILFTSEVVAETGEGRLGLWRADGNYRRTGEWATGGIGPHDVKRIPGTDRLVAANGGIRTDPLDRTPLNLETMRPNLALLSESGEIADHAELAAEYAQNSIRHLAVLPDETIAFAMQWQGDPAEPVPLLGLWRPGSAPRLCPPREADGFAMQGYAGSIASDRAGEKIAITSPRGGVVQVYGRDGSPVTSYRRTDVCGIAASLQGFITTDGGGSISSLANGGDVKLLRHFPAAWDNHIVDLAGTTSAHS